MKKTIVGILAGIALVVGIVACGPAKTGSLGPNVPKVNASQSAVARSDAKALARCLPTGATQQIELAHSLTTHSGREALTAKCGIPPQNKQRFESQVLAAAESGHLTTHAGRTQFFSVTLAQIIEANQG